VPPRRRFGNVSIDFLALVRRHFFFFVAFFVALAGALALVDLAAALAGFVAALAPFFLPANTLSQFLLNSGLGPERTIGPDMLATTPAIDDCADRPSIGRGWNRSF
jgi:hypothetical protein